MYGRPKKSARHRIQELRAKMPRIIQRKMFVSELAMKYLFGEYNRINEMTFCAFVPTLTFCVCVYV